MSFKKAEDVCVATKSLLRQKEAKQLHERIIKLMPSADESSLANILPIKSLEVRKFTTKLLAYTTPTNKAIMFVDIDQKGAGKLVPTVYALWECPSLLPSVLIQSQVSTFIVGGADLMLPGVLVGSGACALPPFSVGSLVSIRVAGNPAPIAVGQALLSREACLEAGMRGRGVRVLHHYGDALWDHGGRARPNEGFQGNMVLSIGHREPSLLDAGGEEGDGKDSEEQKGADSEVQGEAGEGLAEGREGEGTGAHSASWWNALEPDALVLGCLCQALKRTVRSSDLPLLANVLYGTHMAQVRPAHSELQLAQAVKRSSWKKTAEFFLAMGKAGLLKVDAPADRPGVLLITSWDKAHPHLKAHRLWPVAEEAGRASAAAAGGGEGDSEGEDGGQGGSAPSSWQPPVVEELLRPHTAAVPVVFTSLAVLLLGGKGEKIPGVALVHRGRHKGGGPKAAKALSTALVPLAQRIRAALIRLGQVRGEEAEGDGSDDDDEEDEEEAKEGGEQEEEGKDSSEPEGEEEPEQERKALSLEGLVSLMPAPSSIFFTKADALSLLTEYSTVRKLQDPGKDIESRKRIRLDEALARAVAKPQAKGPRVREKVNVAAGGAAVGLSSVGEGGRAAGLHGAMDAGCSAEPSRATDEWGEYVEGEEEEEGEGGGTTVGGGGTEEGEKPVVVGKRKKLPILPFDPADHVTSLAATAEELEGAPSLAKEDVGRAWVKRLEAWYSITYRIGGTSEVVVKRGAPPALRVSVRKLQGGRRAVTAVTGMDAFRLDPADLATRLQKLVAGAATIQPVPSNPTQTEIAVQGSEAVRVGEYLLSTFSLPKKCVVIEEEEEAAPVGAGGGGGGSGGGGGGGGGGGKGGGKKKR